jgi:hypothetical protein
LELICLSPLSPTEMQNWTENSDLT